MISRTLRRAADLRRPSVELQWGCALLVNELNLVEFAETRTSETNHNSHSGLTWTPESAHVTSEGDGSSLALMDVSDFTVADRIGMDDLLTRYATAIDSLDWELLDAVFTNDARIDYRSSGGIEGSYPEVRRWLAEVLPLFDVTQHLVLNREFDRNNDGVHARSCFLNINRLELEGKPSLFTVGGRYHDRLVNTTDGWRIARRVEHTLWWDNPIPGLPAIPFPMAESLDR